MNKSFLYPSFDTIAGSGKNGAIVHYRAKKENCRNINKKDVFLCDSGGQYEYGKSLQALVGYFRRYTSQYINRIRFLTISCRR